MALKKPLVNKQPFFLYFALLGLSQEVISNKDNSCKCYCSSYLNFLYVLLFSKQYFSTNFKSLSHPVVPDITGILFFKAKNHALVWIWTLLPIEINLALLISKGNRKVELEPNLLNNQTSTKMNKSKRNYWKNAEITNGRLAMVGLSTLVIN